MPELPEVENFRQILLPLIGQSKNATQQNPMSAKQLMSPTMILDCPSPTPPKIFPSKEIISLINNGGYIMTNVLRKGKVLCVVLQNQIEPPSSLVVADDNQKKKNSEGQKATTSPNDLSHVPKAENSFKFDTVTQQISGSEPQILLSLRMGMTGRISSPNHVPRLKSLSDDDSYPPLHAHLIFKSPNGKEACFSDSRRFGSVLVHGCRVGGNLNQIEEQTNSARTDDNNESTYEKLVPAFQGLAPDALQTSEWYSKGADQVPDLSERATIFHSLINQQRGIKTILLDQHAVMSGIGNWVADEVLYRSCIHPDQKFLDMSEAKTLVLAIHHVLSTAITCLKQRDDFPSDWLFHHRWRKGKSMNCAKDSSGNAISFLQSGGRSSAIVPSLQKVNSRKEATAKNEPEIRRKKRKTCSS